MANKLRNEVDIKLAGVKRTMRADFDAMMAIESDLNSNVVSIINRFSRFDFGIKDVAIVIFHGLKSAEGLDGMTLKDVGNAVLETGLDKVAVPAVDFVRLSLQGVSLGKSEKAAAPK